MTEGIKTESLQRKVLAKAISYRDYVSIGLGDMVGIGWVIVAGTWLIKGGPLGAMLAFFIGGILLIAVGKCYAELTSAIPVAGGEVAFAYKAFKTGPAFLTGWFLSLGYITVCPFETTSLGWLFEVIFPAARTQPLYSIGGYSISLSSIFPGILIGLFIIVQNYRSVKNTARFQTGTVYAMFACVIIFVVVALIKGDFSNLAPLFANNGSVIAASGSVIAVLGMVPWFMSGFDAIPQAAEESGEKMEHRYLGKAIVVSIIGGIIFYVIVILALSLCMPWQESVQFEMPTAEVFRAAFGYEWAARIVLFAAFCGLITTLNGTFLASTRLVFSLGRGGLLPQWFGEVNEKHHSPKNAILFVGALTLLGPFIGKSSLLPIVNVGAFCFVTCWVITCLAAVNLRKTAPEMNRPYTVKYSATLYLGAAISAILTALMIIPGSAAQLDWPLEYIILSGWMAAGYIGYRWRLSRKDMTTEERDYMILDKY